MNNLNKLLLSVLVALMSSSTTFAEDRSKEEILNIAVDFFSKKCFSTRSFMETIYETPIIIKETKNVSLVNQKDLGIVISHPLNIKQSTD